ncbi:MAG: hypothetical protein JJT94_04465 [Bernardetiaceae bacterium]|nr:hypothetical protein [Bernardetiaceae bacterium]
MQKTVLALIIIGFLSLLMSGCSSNNNSTNKNSSEAQEEIITNEPEDSADNNNADGNDTHVWQNHGIQFKAPSTVTIIENTERHFEGKCKDLGLKIEADPLVMDKEFTLDNLQEILRDYLSHYEEFELIEKKQVKINGFEGFQIKGLEKGKPIIKAFMLSPDGTQSFMMLIEYAEEKDALFVLDSVKLI